VEVHDLARQVLAIGGLDGVTYSGGEPFEQALPLAELSRILKRSGLTIVVYSGYTLSALEGAPERFGSLLREADILIDGEYREELSGAYRWRGSANQQIHTLSQDRYDSSQWRDGIRESQLAFGADGLRLTGFPSEDFEETLLAGLRRQGVVARRKSAAH